MVGVAHPPPCVPGGSAHGGRGAGFWGLGSGTFWEGSPDARLWVAQELVKHTQDAMEKENLRLALDAMRVRGHARGGGWAHGHAVGKRAPAAQ